MVTWNVLCSGSSSSSTVRKKQFNKKKGEKKRKKKGWEKDEKGKRRWDKGKTLIHESLELVEGILGNKAHFFVVFENERMRKKQKPRREEKRIECFVWLFFVALASLTHYLLSGVESLHSFPFLHCYRCSTAHQSLMLCVVIPLNAQSVTQR